MGRKYLKAREGKSLDGLINISDVDYRWTRACLCILCWKDCSFFVASLNYGFCQKKKSSVLVFVNAVISLLCPYFSKSHIIFILKLYRNTS